MLCSTMTEPKQSICYALSGQSLNNPCYALPQQSLNNPYVMPYQDRALTIHMIGFTTTEPKQSICYALSGQSLNNPYAMPDHKIKQGHALL